MDWDDLHVMLEIMRHGSLSGAARSLGVTQPTVGRRLAAIEAKFGAQLVQKTPSGFVPTALGTSLFELAEEMEANALAAERKIMGGDAKLDGTVRITTVDTLAGRIVVPALAKLNAQHPRIAFELIPATRSLSLTRREADIALRVAPFEHHEIVARKVGCVALAYYAARDSRFADGDTSNVITLLDDQAHLPEARAIDQRFPDAHVVFRTNSRDAIYGAVVAGAGIGILPRYRADDDERLVRLFSGDPDLRRDLWMGVHSDMRRMPRIRAVMDCLIDHLHASRSLLDPDGA